MEDEVRLANARLAGADPGEIVTWALGRARRPMVTTSFGPHAAATLHAVYAAGRPVPVVWVDTGWNTPATYRHVEHLTRLLALDLRVYAPDLTRARIEAVDGSVPSLEDADRHAAFSRDVKLRPFERALAELAPDVWITGIRREETDWRRGLDIVTRGPRGTLKVAPFFEASESDVGGYLCRHGLPLGDAAYHDPAKALPHRECGLHARPAPA